MLLLDSLTPPGLGLPIVIRAQGAPGAGLGYLLLAEGPAALPFEGGTFLVDPSSMLIEAAPFGSNGSWSLATVLPPGPTLEGVEIWFQAVAFGQPGPAVLLSNGLKVTLCSW